ncbi:MAG TPA: glycosyltransferase [Streptosporangiaceae bacterium]|nr:glycosyltransferase [Streptosporangiaceae bacterium]
MITFLIVAHNEAEYVENVIAQTCDAISPGDRVLLVDSASTDDTAALGRARRIEVVDAPLGKGAAMVVGARRVTTPWLCFLDGDLMAREPNVPRALRRSVERADDDTIMVVGDFAEPPPGAVLSNTIAVYGPLVRALVPEAAGRFGTHPLSGFRALRPWLVDANLPPDFGAETYLNLLVALSGSPWTVSHLGTFPQRFRYHGADMGREIAKAVLDVAVSCDRLAPELRGAWEEWVGRVTAEIAGYHAAEEDREAHRARIMRLAATPLPPRVPRAGREDITFR